MIESLIEHLVEAFADQFKPISGDEYKKRLKDRFEQLAKEQEWIKNPDGTYSCEEDVDISGLNLTFIPVRFKDVKGYFYCSFNKLTTLIGAPIHVGGNFYCTYNNLTTLQYAPKNIGRNFWCYSNNLRTLQGAPIHVGGNFNCSYNRLTTLQGAPKNVGGSFGCSYNNLTTLQGAPIYVGRSFGCSNNPVSIEKLKQTVNREYLRISK